MKQFVLVGVLLVLGLPLAAQAAQVAPPGYDSKEGERYETVLGAYAEGRFQHGEGGLRGRFAVIRRIGYRLDNRSYYSSIGMGRSWTNVQIHLSHCDATKLSRTWTKNSTDTPVKMFDAKYSWPTQTGRPKSTPSPFDTALSFPLIGNFIYKGVQDLLVDYRFRGGVLANKGNWGRVGARIYFRSYFLDASNVLFNPPKMVQATFTLHGSNNCTDSSHANPPLMVPDLKAYAKATGSATTSDKFSFQMSSYFTAPGKPVIQALGILGSTTGTNIGACNRLHITPLLFYPATASGLTSAAHTNFGYVPYSAKAVGVTIWVQAGYADSQTGVFSLSKAASVVVPQQPPSPSPRYMVYYYDTVRTTGFGPYNSWSVNPIVSYSLK